jgi:hypothetical protein
MAEPGRARPRPEGPEGVEPLGPRLPLGPAAVERLRRLARAIVAAASGRLEVEHGVGRRHAISDEPLFSDE